MTVLHVAVPEYICVIASTYQMPYNARLIVKALH